MASRPSWRRPARTSATVRLRRRSSCSKNRCQVSVQRDFIKQDIEFYQAYCAAKLALSGEGQIIDAGRQLNSFVHNYPNNFHYLDACEMMGDLLMASGRFESAEKQYAELAKAPWPDYKMRAAVAWVVRCKRRTNMPRQFNSSTRRWRSPTTEPTRRIRNFRPRSGKA